MLALSALDATKYSEIFFGIVTIIFLVMVLMVPVNKRDAGAAYLGLFILYLLILFIWQTIWQILLF